MAIATIGFEPATILVLVGNRLVSAQYSLEKDAFVVSDKQAQQLYKKEEALSWKYKYNDKELICSSAAPISSVREKDLVRAIKYTNGYTSGGKFLFKNPAQRDFMMRDLLAMNGELETVMHEEGEIWLVPWELQTKE